MVMVRYRDWRTSVMAILLGMAVLSAPHSAMSQRVASRDEIASTLSIEKITTANGTVSGEIHNRGAYSAVRFRSSSAIPGCGTTSATQENSTRALPPIMA